MNITSLSTSLFDYFLVSGLPHNGIPMKSSSSALANNDEWLFKPALLWRFPSDRNENPWNIAVQDTLIQLCHPRGAIVQYGIETTRPLFHSFLSTRGDGFRFYGHVLTFYDKVKLSTHDKLKENILQDNESAIVEHVFAQKCITLISRFPYIRSAEKILRSLYTTFTKQGKSLDCSTLPIESYIYNLLFQLPVPLPGQSLALKWDWTDAVIMHQPNINELPLLDINLSAVFDLLGGPRNVLRLLTSAFLEHQILLVSEDCQKLIIVAEAVISLMFPFKWSHTYVPVLPYELASLFLDAPVPYIMGIPLTSSDEKLVQISSEFDQCFVNIDKAVVECPEDQPAFPDQITLLSQLSTTYKKFGRRSRNIGSLREEPSEIVETSSPVMQKRTPERSDISINIEECNPEDKVVDDLANLHAICNPRPKSPDLKSLRAGEDDIQQEFFNIQVREMIFGTLISVFSQYDKFVIQPELDEIGPTESWLISRESQNFDKSSFLSDQRESNLLFLSPFLETQAFASLIDCYIHTQLDDKLMDHGLTLLNDRIKQAKELHNSDKPQTIPHNDMDRSLSIISAGRSAKRGVETWVMSSQNAIKKRLTNVNGRYKSLEQILNTGGSAKPAAAGSFPQISNPSLLLKPTEDYHQETVPTNVASISLPKRPLVRQPSVTSEFSHERIAQTNNQFLDKLLKDVKSKTMRLVVCKFGHDAHALGHLDTSVQDLEENTLIGSLCDLLERIWNHGLNADQKRGKSALWSHLLRYQEDFEEDEINRGKRVSVGTVSPVLPNLESSSVTSSNLNYQQYRSSNRHVVSTGSDLLSNIKQIRKLDEVKTNIGKCRAFIRLSLEQKQLKAHLKKLLTNRPLLQVIYKRYSLLRCIDEREQFLYHLLALNAVDFQCFSNSFTKTGISYNVCIVPSKQISGASQTTANVYMKISGELSCTEKISVHKGCNDFRFFHQNLGILTTMLLGHDNSGFLPRWHVDHVIVTNELTGQASYFPCGRWLGHGVDDGSTQRLLIGHRIPLEKDPSTFWRDIEVPALVPKDIKVNLLRDMIGQYVNNIVQHLGKDSGRPSSPGTLTELLLKPNGLMTLLNVIFSHGLRSSGILRRRPYAWDIILGACDILSGKEEQNDEPPIRYKTAIKNIVYNTPNSSPRRSLTGSSQPLSSFPSQNNARHEEEFRLHKTEMLCGKPEMSVAVLQLLNVTSIINNEPSKSLGKDDMFQLFICTGLKRHILPDWLALISSSLMKRSSFYERDSFMFDKDAVCSVCKILESLNEYSVNFEQILWRGFESSLKI